MGSAGALIVDVPDNVSRSTDRFKWENGKWELWDTEFYYE